MGYYFHNGKGEKSLSPEQVARYKELRQLSSEATPAALNERLEAIKEFIGPITSGEVWSAYEELLKDAFANWVLADEDPEKVKWVELKVSEPEPPTEEERKRTQEWLESMRKEPELPQQKTLLGRIISFLRRES